MANVNEVDVVVMAGEYYVDITVDTTNKVAKNGETVVANLEVAFDIKVTVSQVD